MSSVESEFGEFGYLAPEYECEEPEESQESEISKEERQSLCKAFTLLDTDGDGVIDPEDLKKLLISLGRLPMGDELDDIMFYAEEKGCEGDPGMDFKGFRKYFMKQLANTNDEDELREAFQVFDTVPPTGRVNLSELRNFLKRDGLKLTDDEIDFLYKEQNYWMLEEKYKFEYQELINKLLDKPFKSKFLGD